MEALAVLVAVVVVLALAGAIRLLEEQWRRRQ